MRSHFLKSFLLFAVVFLTYGIEAQAGCKGLNFSLQNALVRLNDDPRPILMVTVTRTENGPCDFFLTMNNGTAATYTDRRLLHGSRPDYYPVQFYVDSGRSIIFKSINEAATANVLSGTFSGNASSTNLYYYPVVDPNLSVPNGSYSGGFDITLYEGTLSSYSNPQAKNVNFKYFKGGYVDLSLVDTGAAFNVMDVTQLLDFGNLVAGDTKAFDIVLEYNAGYSLSMSSLNGGYVKNTNTALTSSNLIAYTMKLSGATITLSNAMEVKSISAAGAETSPLGGTRLPVSVTIGNVNGVHPGTYTDTVSISVTSIN